MATIVVLHHKHRS